MVGSSEHGNESEGFLKAVYVLTTANRSLLSASQEGLGSCSSFMYVHVNMANENETVVGSL